MKRRDFLKSTVASAVAGLTAAISNGCSQSSLDVPPVRQKTKTPNFVVIFTDDQGYESVGCYGAKGFKTPNLDRMADEGVRFTDFYCGAPSCTPSRAALMTGCYPLRVGLSRVLYPVGPTAREGINSDEVTIAQMLKKSGYATACFGKWHLGQHPQFLPTRRGFDEYFGLPTSNDVSPKHPQIRGFPDLPLIENEKIIEYNPDQTRLTTWYTQRAVKFIEKNKDKPFFLYVPHSMPHVPLHVSGKFKGKSKQGLYGDVIMEIDWSVGQILDAVKRCGLDENTLVVFTSDDGPWLSYGNHAGSAGPLREGKATTFEGGQRVPCIMRWPGKIPAGITCYEPAVVMDILPTFAALANAALPEKRIDGKNIFPLMEGKPNAKSPHEAIFFYFNRNLEALRCGKWKLHFPHQYNTLAGRKGGTDGKPVLYEKAEIGLALFNLEDDIGEEHNVAEQYPEIVERLSALADKMRSDLGDGLTNTKGANQRPPGRITLLDM